MAVALLASTTDLLRSAGQRSEPAQTVLAGAFGLTALTLCAAVALNRYSPGVHWHAFRHYAAAQSFLMIAISMPARRLSSGKATTLLLSFSTCALVLLLVYGKSLVP
jgi:hypothetical protein